jgi:hypothetical protein
MQKMPALFKPNFAVLRSETNNQTNSEAKETELRESRSWLFYHFFRKLAYLEDKAFPQV